MKHILILLCALLGLGSCQSGNSTEIDNRTVQTFDVPRFMGKWHEIARYDHRFEKGMTRVTALLHIAAKAGGLLFISIKKSGLFFRP